MRIDHLVWYTPDLEQGCRFFAERLAAVPLHGGEHPGEGTANALLSLGPQTYLEILGRDVAQPEEALDAEVRSLKGSGLYHWAIGGADLGELAARARDAGLAGGELVPGGRIRPDGSRLDWVCWGLRDHSFGSLIPFFIDWCESDHPAASAPAGGRISACAVHSPQAGALREIFRALGLAIPVVDSDTPRVVAVLEGARGQVELASFSPLPRGYVI